MCRCVSSPIFGADFHAVYTAEQAGFYKPRYGAFEYMLDQLNAAPEDVLHVSSHTRYDLMPAHDSDGINPATETITIGLTEERFLIPAGQLKASRNGSNPPGVCALTSLASTW